MESQFDRRWRKACAICKTAGLVLAVLGILALVLIFLSPTTVTVRNNSGHAISAISIVVQDHKLIFTGLPPGASARRWHHNSGRDDHFTLLAIRDDGERVEASGGYITSGSFFGSAEFTRTPSGAVAFTEEYH